MNNIHLRFLSTSEFLSIDFHINAVDHRIKIIPVTYCKQFRAPTKLITIQWARISSGTTVLKGYISSFSVKTLTRT